MAFLRTLPATITAIERADPEAIWGRAQVVGESTERRIVAYPRLTGAITVGDPVVLNVTATALGLGTGGVDFVYQGAHAPDGKHQGEHIVKLRYTPLQHAVAAAEQSAAPTGDTLDGLPVVACLLHSQVALVAAAVKALRPSTRVAYLLTDSAALPLGFSRLVGQLRAAELIDMTLTCGQAFGGEWECVTVPSALLVAKHQARADLVIVAPGPGNAGTGTRYGFSGIEQAWVLRCTAALGGRAICCLRASSADPRERHQGLSHHSHTVLSLCGDSPVAPWPAGWPLPDALPGVAVVAEDGAGLALLAERGVRVTSMGRTADQDPLFFAAAAAAGAAAVHYL